MDPSSEDDRDIDHSDVTQVGESSVPAAAVVPAEEPSDNSAHTEALSTRQLFFSVFPSVMLPMFLGILDQTIVSTALPAIAGSLGEVERISWVVISYLLANTLAAPLFGYLGDIFGRRRLMFIALCIFVVATIFCSISPTLVILSLSRFLQGVGGGGMMALSQALIGEAVPPRARGQFQGYLATNAVVSSLVGPIAGGFLTEHFGWRSIFLFSLPLALIAFVLIARLKPRAGNRQQGWRFDTAGFLSFVAFIVPALLAVGTARTLIRDTPVLFVGLIAIAVTALVFLLHIESRVESPFLPLDLLRKTALWRADALAACHGAAVVSIVTFLPIYLRVARNVSTGELGVLLIPLTAGIGIGSMLTGRTVTRTGYTMIFPTLGLIGASLTLLFISLAAPLLPPPAISVAFALNSMLMGTVMGVVQITVQQAAGHGRLGSAAASVQLTRSIGASFGTAIVGGVLFSTLALADPQSASMFDAILEVGPNALATLDDARRSIVETEIAGAFRAAFLTVVVFTACGAVLAWINPSRRV